jgi:hypothetical protein
MEAVCSLETFIDLQLTTLYTSDPTRMFFQFPEEGMWRVDTVALNERRSDR